MPDLEDMIADLSREDHRTARITDALVSAVQEDGTVNLLYKGTVLSSVNTLRSYTKPAKGDTVAVAVMNRRFIVLGPYGFVAEDDAVVPGTATVQPTERGSWIGNLQDDYHQEPTQGIAPLGIGPITGGWFYGTDLRDALAAPVDKIEFYMSRAKTGGNPEGVRPEMYLHAEQVAPVNTPALVAGPYDPLSLEVGEGGWFTLPDSWTEMLVDGDAEGVAIYTGGTSRFLVSGASSGKIVVTYT